MSQHRTINWTRLTVSEDQNTIKSFRFGAATFVPVDPMSVVCICCRCIFQGEPECNHAPCDKLERKDERDGYWWKHVDKEHSPN